MADDGRSRETADAATFPDDPDDPVETVETVETALRADPAGIYDQCSAATRRRYVDAVLELSRWSGRPGDEVVATALRLSGAQSRPGERPDRHVGGALIGPLRRELETDLGCRPPAFIRFARTVAGRARTLYLGGIALVTISLVAAACLTAYAAGGGAGVVGLVGVLVLPLAARTGQELVDLTVSMFLPSPAPLPRLEFPSGIPEPYRTSITYPVIVGTAADADTVLHSMRENYRRNPDAGILHVLLLDLSDADQRETATDQEVLDAVREKAAALNAEVNGSSDGGPFLMLHRTRGWNPAERLWMGWERKRGKLLEYNRVILGDGSTHFVVEDSARDLLRSVRFVITLDEDTRLTPGAAHELIGALAHPLNHPVIDRSGGVTAGYSILQPRIELAPEDSISLFRAMAFGLSNPSEGDRETRNSIYQTCFSEELYSGVGIYHVAAFQSAVGDTIPENSVLSHDRLEGMYARTASISDVAVRGRFGGDYLIYRQVSHRWTRGDVAMLGWIFGRRPAGTAAAPLNALHRWQLLVGLCRPTGYVAAFLLLVLAWLGVAPGGPLLWSAVALLGLAMSVVVRPVAALTGGTLAGLAGAPPRTRRGAGRRIAAAAVALAVEVVRWLLFAFFVADLAIVHGDALLRGAYRAVIRRRVLEWKPAGQATRQVRGHSGARRRWREMAAAPVASIALATLLLLTAPPMLGYAAPLLAAWFLSPQVAYWTATLRVRSRGSLPRPSY